MLNRIFSLMRKIYESNIFHLSRSEEKNRIHESGEWFEHLGAGAIAGTASRTCTAPLTRIAVFLQVSSSNRGILAGFQKLIRRDGISGLWKGNLTNILKGTPNTALKFTTYEEIKKILKGDRNSDLNFHERLIAGSLAGGLCISLLYPLDVLDIRFMLRKPGQYRSIWDAATKMFLEEGPRCFFRGYVPNVLSAMPYSGIEFAVYETLKAVYLQGHPKNHQPPFWVLFASINASCVMGQVCTFPLDLVGTRMQAQASRTTMKKVFNALIQKYGARGLYKGFGPQLIRIVPFVSINYVIYEYTSRLIDIKMT